MDENAAKEAEAFFHRWGNTPRKLKGALAAQAPVPAIQAAATGHADPWFRRACLAFLDHHASDASSAVFVAALADPVAPVRAMALHGLACETCRTEQICVPEVGPRVSVLLASDPDPEVRAKTIPVMLRLADRYPAALEAVECAANADTDERVRLAAAEALSSRPRRWSNVRRRARSSRRHRTAP